MDIKPSYTPADRMVGTSSPDDVAAMLAEIGVSSEQELIDQVIPHGIRLRKPLQLGQEGMSESEFSAHMASIAEHNIQFRSYIGMGFYPNSMPAVIRRNIFENPSWYTSYTPYQAEISQGRLEALLNFQTMVTSMTAMEIANCSLLDEATAAAEAVLMMYALRGRDKVAAGANVLFVDQNIFPQTLDVILTRSEAHSIEIIVDSFENYQFTGKEFGVFVQYPAADGTVCRYADFTRRAHEAGALVAVSCDLMAMALLTPPGEWDADIAVGSSQRFGLPMGFGGPHAGFMATRDRFKRSMPGRIIGVSVDRLGNRALRMALQTREQHIKRERATSNICTASALMAIMSGMYAVYNGPDGIRSISAGIHQAACAVYRALEAMGYTLRSDVFFDTIQVEQVEASVIQSIALERGINFFYPSDTCVRLSLDELAGQGGVDDIVSVFAEAASKSLPKSARIRQETRIPEDLTRRSGFLEHDVFGRYHTEMELQRYIKHLEHRDISLMDNMIPLGSCTMKLNPAALMMPLSLDGLANMHPFAPESQTEGYRMMISSLESDLAVITGMAGCTLMPNSGAAGEYTGLMILRAYHQAKGHGYRNVVLIPASAHGTNPASAAMAGMKVVTVACDALGNIDVEDLRAKAEQHRDDLCAVMITYPSTHGIFESRVRDIIDIVHDNGGQVYMDGANMNAQVGLTNPGYIGADVCHLNLHKTFAMPHGGGGPGVGPVCVARHLVDFLPSHSVVPVGGDDGITAVSSAPWGSAMLLAVTYGYIRMLGTAGLERMTVRSILNANYMASRLSREFGIYYRGESGRVGHEFILDLTSFRKSYGVECADVARRLMDYGFHAPTLSFPVHETLMIEPTESESKQEMDRFMEALVSIKSECEEFAGSQDSIVCQAPYTAREIAGEWNHSFSRERAAFPLEWVAEDKFFPYVTKIDNGYGDRNLVAQCERTL